jgi:hypothetical protein
MFSLIPTGVITSSPTRLARPVPAIMLAQGFKKSLMLDSLNCPREQHREQHSGFRVFKKNTWDSGKGKPWEALSPNRWGWGSAILAQEQPLSAFWRSSYQGSLSLSRSLRYEFVDTEKAVRSNTKFPKTNKRANCQQNMTESQSIGKEIK